MTQTGEYQQVDCSKQMEQRGRRLAQLSAFWRRSVFTIKSALLITITIPPGGGGERHPGWVISLDSNQSEIMNSPLSSTTHAARSDQHDPHVLTTATRYSKGRWKELRQVAVAADTELADYITCNVTSHVTWLIGRVSLTSSPSTNRLEACVSKCLTGPTFISICCCIPHRSLRSTTKQLLSNVKFAILYSMLIDITRSLLLLIWIDFTCHLIRPHFMSLTPTTLLLLR